MQENITIYPHIFNTLSIDFIMALSNTLKKFLCEFIVCCLPLLHILSVCWILYEFKLTLYLVLDVLLFNKLYSTQNYYRKIYSNKEFYYCYGVIYGAIIYVSDNESGA